jgi:hypothetical protein
MRRARARRTDPRTSKDAARRMEPKALPLAARFYDLLLDASETGLTYGEAAEILGEPRDSISPRGKNLQAEGLIKNTGLRRDGQIVWSAR